MYHNKLHFIKSIIPSIAGGITITTNKAKTDQFTNI